MNKLFIVFCFISLAATCQENNSKDQIENPCDPDIMCTMEFRIINLEVRNESGGAIFLDDFYSEINGEKIEIPDDVYESKDGFYPVATDGQMKVLDFEGNEIIFYGLINGEIVVEHKMIIGKDCCHIQSIEGVEKITVSF
jgi:hypothetical protein